MLIGGHGEAGMGVAEAFAHDLGRCAGGDEQAGVGVAKVVDRVRGSPVGARCRSNSWLIDSPCTGRPAVLVNVGSARPTGCPSCSWRAMRGGARTTSAARSRSTQRRLVRVSLDGDFDRAAGDALPAAGHRQPMPGLVPVKRPESVWAAMYQPCTTPTGNSGEQQGTTGT